MKKEVKKNKKSKNITNKIKEKIKIILPKIKKFIIKNYYILIVILPFILIDILTRILGYKIHFYRITKLVPNLFTILWITLIIGISLFLEKKKGKIMYIIFFVLSFFIFLLNNIYYSISNSFFDFSLLQLAGEGSSYFMDAIINCNIWVYISGIIIIIAFINGLKYYPKRNKSNIKNIIKIICIFLIGHFITPFLLGAPDDELTWSTWKNPRNIYMSYNDNNKSMRVSGIYEYTFRNFYITFMKPKETNNEKEKNFLEEVYNTEEKKYSNKNTGLLKDKNLIIIQLEGVDSWLLNKTDTPTLYKLMNSSINYTNHYSYYNGGGSTFNSEFAVNTGFITPLTYTQNAYTFNKNSFPYSLANLFKKEGYTVEAFHMNTSEYYSRGTNYKNWGYDNYFGLKDLGTYKDNSYELDRELILNETFKEEMFNSEKFVNYIITYSSHLPFTTQKGVCKALIEEDYLKENDLKELPKDYISPELSEEQCARRQVKETDYMVELLLQTLEEKQLIDNTAIVVFTDHYLYTLSDQTILSKYKETSNNLINKTPFFIWSNDISKRRVKKVTSQLNILPTLLNLFDLEYHPNYYIGEDSLNSKYDGIVFFNDYAWYDGKVYVDGGKVTNNKHIDALKLEEKNYNINYIIRKNDLTLKYDYFKKIEEKNKNNIKGS